MGGITNGKEKTREIELDFDFLPKGRTYTMTYFEDGINAGRQWIQVKAGEKITIKMARNGSWEGALK